MFRCGTLMLNRAAVLQRISLTAAPFRHRAAYTAPSISHFHSHSDLLSGKADSNATTSSRNKVKDVKDALSWIREGAAPKGEEAATNSGSAVVTRAARNPGRSARLIRKENPSPLFAGTARAAAARAEGPADEWSAEEVAISNQLEERLDAELRARGGAPREQRDTGHTSARLNPARVFYPGETYDPEELTDNPLKNQFMNRRGKPHCPVNELGLKEVDYKNVKFLLKFISLSGKIMPRRNTGCTAKNQRKVGRAIKRARAAGLLPYTSKPSLRPPPRFASKTL